MKEVKKTIEYYEKFNNKKIKNIIVCGGTSKMPGLLDFFYAKLQPIDKKTKRNVLIGNPFEFLNTISVGGGISKTQMIDYATVIGLALHSFMNGDKSGINLLPKKSFKDKIKSIFMGTKKTKSPKKSFKTVKPKAGAVKKTKGVAAPAAKPDAVMSKIKTPSGESFFTKYKASTISVIAIVVIIAALVAVYYILIMKPKSSVPIVNEQTAAATVLNEGISYNITVRKISDENLPTGNIPGILVTKLYEEEDSFVPATTETVDAQATGTVILVNESSGTQSLVAITRLLSEDGVLFRLKDAVRIPAGGEVQAEVYADKAGADGNIEPTIFTIPGLSESMQKLIYARSDAVMTGGTRKAGIFNVEDVEAALESLKKKVINNAIEDFKNDLDYAGNIFLPDLASAEILESGSDTEIGTETKEFNITAKIEVGILIFSEGAVADQGKTVLGSKISDVDVNNFAVYPEGYLLNSFDRSNYKVDLTVNARVEKVQ